MKVGVVCEGQTDFIALKSFLEKSLDQKGVQVSIEPVHPKADCTQSAGWPKVLAWLDRNPPEMRMITHLGNGLFAGGLSAKNFDALLFQIDTDILGDDGFQNTVRDKCGELIVSLLPHQRVREIERVLAEYGKFADLDEAGSNRHVLAVAAESTETWCVAAFKDYDEDPETFDTERLTQEFGRLLAGLRGQIPQERYAKINKSILSRKFVCDKLGDTQKLERQCCNYRKVVDDLLTAFEAM